MNLFQKLTIPLVLIVALAAAFYAARQQSVAHRQAQATQEQQTALNQTIERLQRERDEATNRLAAMAAEVAGTNQPQSAGEVLKLRGQVGTLRHELAATEAKANAPTAGFAKMMNDPAMREYIKQSMVDLVKKRYSGLFQELKLTPEQSEQFVQAMTAEFQKGAQRLAAAQQAGDSTFQPGPDDHSDLTNALHEVLGDAGMARFGEYSMEIPARTTVDMVDGKLGAAKLTDDQKAQLFQAVKSEPFNLTHGISGDLDKAFFGSQEQIDSYLASIAESNQRVLDQAGSFLTTEQLDALKNVLNNGIAARKTQAAALTAKH
jgi:hypothetical protein